MIISSMEGLAPAPQPSKCRSQIKVNACGGINSIAEDAITFVHRFACILKAKPERPPGDCTLYRPHRERSQGKPHEGV